MVIVKMTPAFMMEEGQAHNTMITYSDHWSQKSNVVQKSYFSIYVQFKSPVNRKHSSNVVMQ